MEKKETGQSLGPKLHFSKNKKKIKHVPHTSGAMGYHNLCRLCRGMRDVCSENRDVCRQGRGGTTALRRDGENEMNDASFDQRTLR